MGDTCGTPRGCRPSSQTSYRSRTRPPPLTAADSPSPWPNTAGCRPSSLTRPEEDSRAQPSTMGPLSRERGTTPSSDDNGAERVKAVDRSSQTQAGEVGAGDWSRYSLGASLTTTPRPGSAAIQPPILAPSAAHAMTATVVAAPASQWRMQPWAPGYGHGRGLGAAAAAPRPRAAGSGVRDTGAAGSVEERAVGERHGLGGDSNSCFSAQASRAAKKRTQTSFRGRQVRECVLHPTSRARWWTQAIKHAVLQLPSTCRLTGCASNTPLESCGVGLWTGGCA